MKLHLQLVLFLQLTKVCLPQTCYTQCLQNTSASAMSINVMLVDSNGSWQATRQWFDSKTVEFNALYPAISVELSHVQYEDMVSQAQVDLEKGTNLYEAYIIPFMNGNGGTARLSDRLMDMSVFTVDNVNNIQWHTIGRYFRSHAALYEAKVLTLPLTGDFISMYYRRDLFTTYGLTVPRTLEEYVVASQVFNNTDLNGDGEPDYGSCFPHTSDTATGYFFAWISQVLQYRGTSQGSTFDTQTLAPLLDNPAVQEAIKLWKEVAGPPETTRGTTPEEEFILWFTGRCAMTLSTASLYTIFQSAALDEMTGVTTMPGSERVWWREGSDVVKCNTSFCRHATQYPDGAVVNHAPNGFSLFDGAINGQISMDKQLAAFTYLTWLMSDTNMVEGVLNTTSWPKILTGTVVKPSLLVPSVWTPYGWGDPAVSMVCATAVANMNHANAVIGWRLPNAHEYHDAMEDILIGYWRGTGEFEDLDQDVGAVVVSARLSTALQEVTERRDREALIVSYQKSLNIYAKDQTLRREGEGDIIPYWAVFTIAGMLGGTVCLACSFVVYWLISTVLQRHRLHAQQRETWDSIVDAAENYAASLGCPMALVSATNFLDLGCITHFEAIRDADILRVLDTVEKVTEFKRKFVIVFLSYNWLTTPDSNSVHFETMCAAVRRATNIANVSLDRVFLWVYNCSIPQDGRENISLTHLLPTAPPCPGFTQTIGW